MTFSCLLLFKNSQAFSRLCGVVALLAALVIPLRASELSGNFDGTGTLTPNRYARHLHPELYRRWNGRFFWRIHHCWTVDRRLQQPAALRHQEWHDYSDFFEWHALRDELRRGHRQRPGNGNFQG